MNRKDKRKISNKKMRCDNCGVKCKTKNLRRKRTNESINNNPILCKQCWEYFYGR